MKFWNFVKNSAEPEKVELRISGEIVDDDSAWIYEWFGISSSSPNSFREELKAHAGKDLTVWIDSWGGSTTAAAGIYNALKEHDGKVTVKIDGKAVSAASVIAMAGDEILMSPVGVMMIHNPWTGVSGEAKDLRHVADVLDIIKGTIVNAYQMKTGRDKEEIAQMMDNETWMSAKAALSEKFIDGILYDESSSKPVKNSFMFNHRAIQNSASAAMQTFIEQYKNGIIPGLENKEDENLMEIKNLDDLKKAYPDLVNQVVNDSILNERKRITGLDEIDDPKNAAVHEIVQNAKASGKTVEEITPFVDIVKKHAPDAKDTKNAQEQFLNTLKDNKKSGVDGIEAGHDSQSGDDKEEEVQAINMMAGIINKKNGVKK